MCILIYKKMGLYSILRKRVLVYQAAHVPSNKSSQNHTPKLRTPHAKPSSLSCIPREAQVARKGDANPHTVSGP